MDTTVLVPPSVSAASGPARQGAATPGPEWRGRARTPRRDRRPPDLPAEKAPRARRITSARMSTAAAGPPLRPVGTAGPESPRSPPARARGRPERAQAGPTSARLRRVHRIVDRGETPKGNDDCPGRRTLPSAHVTASEGAFRASPPSFEPGLRARAANEFASWPGTGRADLEDASRHSVRWRMGWGPSLSVETAWAPVVPDATAVHVETTI
jgi:hypothetical protein